MAADRELVFGLLALQNGLIDQNQLVDAFQAWILDRRISISQYLHGRGELDASACLALESLLAVHLKHHGGDLQKSLAALPAGSSTRAKLIALNDSEVTVTVARSGSDTSEPGGDDTLAYAVGTETADGQRFRVLRPHARGGLGAVFVALDRELNREVALKQILERHADDPVSRQRFMIEAEITGGLEHPGIVPVYGLGTYRDGRPFYAMRFVRGDSLKQAIDSFHDPERRERDPGRRSLELRKLLRRFLDVCNAIDYAHSRGVLHRDIKPGNIIVGRHGETLVVDWGLARARGQTTDVDPGVEAPLSPSSGSGSAQTLPGAPMGTPTFMSPEQARGDLDALGPRSDVYSLGATLYSLLTGRLAFEGKDIGLLLQAVRRGEFPPPRQLDPTLDPPLEAICLKAMATEPDARYESARALAEEIERWLADEPVVAWPDPWTRRASRWLARHRTAVAAAAAAVLVAMLGLVAVAAVQTWGRNALERKNGELRRVNAALADANRRVESRYRLAADAIRTFHTGVSEDFLLKEPRFKQLRDRLLRSASDFYERLGAQLNREDDLDSRRALADANFELARLTDLVGRKEDALAAHRAVLASREALASRDASLAADVATSRLEIARLLSIMGEPDEALVLDRLAEAQLLAPARDDPSSRRLLGSTRAQIASLLDSLGRRDEAIAAFRQALLDLKPLSDADARGERAEALHRLALCLAAVGRPEEAETSFRDALDQFQALTDLEHGNPNHLYGLAESHNSFAAFLSQVGRWTDSESEYRAGLGDLDTLLRINPAVIHLQLSRAAAHANLGIVFEKTGRIAEAETEYRTALADFEPLAEANPSLHDLRSRVVNSHGELADLLAESGRLDAAEAEYRTAVSGYEELVRDHPEIDDYLPRLNNTRVNFAILLNDTGRVVESEAVYRAAIQGMDDVVKAHPDVPYYQGQRANTHANLGILLATTDRPDQAEAEFRAAVAGFEAAVEANPELVQNLAGLANGRESLGILLRDTNRPDDALVQFRAAADDLLKLSEANPNVVEYALLVANGHLNVGELLIDTDQLEAAESELLDARRRYLTLRRSNPENLEITRLLANAQTFLGDIRFVTGRPEEAEVEYRAALEIRQQLVETYPDVPSLQADLAVILVHLGRLLTDDGRNDEAVAVYQRLVTLRERLDDPSPPQLYALAAYHSLLAGAEAGPRSGVSPEQARIDADRAVATLRRAIDSGFRDLDALRDNPDLDPIRDNPAFVALLHDLAFPAEPFAPER